jgi:hypothetical protein
MTSKGRLHGETVMAQGREQGPRAPRWLNGVAWSLGLLGFAVFTWRLLAPAGGSDAAANLEELLPRLLGAVLLPLLLLATMIFRSARPRHGL